MSETIEKQKPGRHGVAWNAEEERQLYDSFVAGMRVADIATLLDRTTGGVRSHLKKLGLLDEEGATVSPTPDYVPTAAVVKRAAKAAEKKALIKPRAAEAETEETEINPRFAEALHIMTHTTQPLFITGKAGTGKSTLLRHFRRGTKKNMVILAPTGIAALNVGGQTIHHFFRFSIDVTPQKIAARKKIRNAGLYKKLETIVIDEISMVRADIMDCIDAFLRMHGPHPGMAFGGVQMIFIGDMYQLPPVVGAQDREIFSSHYDTPYFFSAHAMQDYAYEKIELEKVYRQKDRDFVALLNRVRNNSVTEADIEQLNSRYDPAAALHDEDFSITLTSTNKGADDINRRHLAALRGKTYESSAEIKGEFGREYFPAAPELAFKIGAQVMMLNNDKEGRWVNGSIGVIENVRTDIDGRDYVAVRLQDLDEPVAVFAHTWEVYHFALADNHIQSEPVGTFTQYPFRLAWAVTIHKSQGKTFNRVTIDIGAGAFAAGQVYVALSRCTSFEGITLKTPIKRRHIQTDPRIQQFMGAGEQLPSELSLQSAVVPLLPTPAAAPPGLIALIEHAIRAQGALEITYLKGNVEEMVLTVQPRALGPEKYKGNSFIGMKAFCPADGEERLFSIDRILQIVMV